MSSHSSGIIPWNATPGKACGSTLGEICNTSEVRQPESLIYSHLFSFLPFASFLCSLCKWKPKCNFQNNILTPVTLSTNWEPLLSSTVLPVLPSLYCCIRGCWCHSHCIGKLSTMMRSKCACCHDILIGCHGNRASRICDCFPKGWSLWAHTHTGTHNCRYNE